MSIVELLISPKKLVCPMHKKALEIIGLENFGIFCSPKPDLSELTTVYKCKECNYCERWKKNEKVEYNSQEIRGN